MMLFMKRAIAGAIISTGFIAPLASQASAAATDCVTQAAATQSAAARFSKATSDYLRLLGIVQDTDGRLHRARLQRRSGRAVTRLRHEAAAARRAARDARGVAYRDGVAFQAQQAENNRCQAAAGAAPTASSPSGSRSLDQLLALLSGGGATLAGMGTTSTEGIPAPPSMTTQENQLIELLNHALQGQAASAGVPGPTYIVPLLLGHG